MDPDQDIVDLIRANLDRAFQMLMDRYGVAVYRFCAQFLRDGDRAKDALQDVFVQAYRDLPRFSGAGRLHGWLFTIARHRCLDRVRSGARAQAHLDDDSPCEDIADRNPSVGDRIDDARLVLALNDCVGELGEHVREAVLLRYQRGLSFEDMAEVCGVQAGTLEARVRRALPVLRACIERRAGGAM